MAVIAGVESAVQLHIDRGDNINARDGNGFTALMLAAARNKSSICQLLLSAGADKDLLAPSGKSAYIIAVDAGALEAAALFEEITPSPDQIPSAEMTATPMDQRASIVDGYVTGSADHIVAPSFDSVETTVFDLRNDDAEQVDLDGGRAFDLLEWEAEEEASPPEVNPAVAENARAIQEFISNHEPFDSSEGWDDVDIYLPDVSLPLARAENPEARELLRLLLLRAVREGSVPEDAVGVLSLNADRSANAQAEALLTMVIRDLGAEVDDRFEYVSVDENFEVFVNPEETMGEADKVADALALLDNLESRYSEPLRLYQKDFQRQKLISAKDEVTLGQAMESALDEALDVLAAWPRGIEITLAAGAMVEARQKPLTWMSTNPTEPQPDLESESLAEDDSITPTSGQMDEEDDIDDAAEPDMDDDTQSDAPSPANRFAGEFSVALTRLADLAISTERGSSAWRAARASLASLRLCRRFLSELADLQIDGPTDIESQYVGAIRDYQNARDRMASANLKLVFHQAKKYLYSGEPLDDLAQEGNLGLLKAIDRYDWRRGFKFSTYATWWIRQHISRYIADKCRTIRLPVHIHEQAQRIVRQAHELEAEGGRPPTLDELATKANVSAQKVSAIQRIAQEPLPMDDLEIDDIIAPDARDYFSSPDPFDCAASEQARFKVAEVLAGLKPKEEQILRLRFGIGIPDALTLEDVGQRYEVTRERVRQIEAKALRKLRVPSKIDLLSHVLFGHSPHKHEQTLDDQA
nr:sigma-70 family RNA polymerase sigma factor [Massilia rhizosphaerae]